MSSTDVRTLRDQAVYRYSWIRLVRPMTWSGTIAPVLIGTALAYQRGRIQIFNCIVMLVAALLVQSTTNMLNDYFDFQKGQDTEDWESSEVSNVHHPITRHKIRVVSLMMIAVSTILGLWLARQAGWPVAVIGTVSITVGYLYSAGKKSLSSLGLGELAAASFMGPVIVALAIMVQREPGHPCLSQS